MARKPNYRFDRMEKDRAKAAKKAERLKVRQERVEKRGQGGDTPENALSDVVEPDTARTEPDNE